MFLGFVSLIIAITLFIVANTFTMHDNMGKAIGAAWLKIFAKLAGVVFLLLSLYSCGTSIGL